MSEYKELLQKAYAEKKPVVPKSSGGHKKLKYNTSAKHIPKTQLVTYFIGLYMILVFVFYWLSDLLFHDFESLYRIYAALNLSAFILFGADKVLATTSSMITRIPERFFIWISFFGASLGIILGAQAFHHKTLKMKFMVWPVVFFVVQLFLFAYLWQR
jgi:uncharacterized membrane protein YsdA (DUF1294 family)